MNGEIKIFNIKYKSYNNRLGQITIEFNRELPWFTPASIIRGTGENYLDVYDITCKIAKWYKENFNVNIGHIKNSYHRLCFCIPKRKRRTLVALKLRFQ